MNIRTIMPEATARQFALGLGGLFTLSTLSIGLMDGFSAAVPLAAVATFNFVTSLMPERVARVLAIVEVLCLVVAGVYTGAVVLRSD